MWDQERPGFDQDRVNSFLFEYAPFTETEKKSILVPLAGRSIDLVYLSERFRKVVAVEWVESAIVDFFKINGWEATKSGMTYQSKNIEFFCGDFFEVAEKYIKECDCLYDRASLVALSLDLRKRYYEVLERTLSPDKECMFVTLNRADENGPPFHVSEDELKMHLPHCELKLLAIKEQSDDRPEWKNLAYQVKKSI